MLIGELQWTISNKKPFISEGLSYLESGSNRYIREDTGV